MDPVVASAMVGAGAGLVGALGTQHLSSRQVLKVKKLELYYSLKAEVYQRLLEAGGAFALEPEKAESYPPYLAAFERARLFASEDVQRALKGLNPAAQALRSAADESARIHLQMTKWHDAMEALASAMRSDLERLSV